MFTKWFSQTTGILWWRSAMIVVLAAVMLVPYLAFGQAQILDIHNTLPDFDARQGTIVPTGEQQAIVNNMGARATWNQFGTPETLISTQVAGSLACCDSGYMGKPDAAALNWIRNNRTLFRLSDQGVNNLELVNVSTIKNQTTGKDSFVVMYRQHFGNLPATHDGIITVAVSPTRDGTIWYAWSSCAGDQPLTGSVILTPTAAWLLAAANIGRPSVPANIKNRTEENGWVLFDVAGFAQTQRARLVALPTPLNGARQAYEIPLLHNSGGQSIAYTMFVDAATGEVLFRDNNVDRLAAAEPPPAPQAQPTPQTQTFTGQYTDPACGPCHHFTVGSGQLEIVVTAAALVPANDIVLSLSFGSCGNVIASSDVLTSPEAIIYNPPGGVPAGDYYVQVCPFPGGTVVNPVDYNGTFTTTPLAVAAEFNQPGWKYFQDSPIPDITFDLAPPGFQPPDTDIRTLACWKAVMSGMPVAGCQLDVSKLSPHPQPWDFLLTTGLPTFTTEGNNARTAESWFNFVAPGPTQQKPFQPDRLYVYPWMDTWANNRCNPAVLVPGGNDILASVTNLFSGHNRMHDWSYFLGFTETNFNMQYFNFGLTAANRQNDPELGDVQAGAVAFGAPTYEGRDNANQITQNDGIPGITNQYLFQPIAGAFYSPCTDGDFDATVYAHEYTHAISNRMIGGPDSGITGYQGGSMGESWSDLNAIEYLLEHGYTPVNGENPLAVGPYVTGNGTVGIRNYAMSPNPLNFSDLGYDLGGAEVHSDGEVWNAVNWEIRKNLNTHYDPTFPSSDLALQKACADEDPGKRVQPQQCPGNRRWIQIMYDGFLLMPPTVTMLQARDAYLMADQLRFGGNDLFDLWNAFAKRGFGQYAFTSSNGDSNPIPNFESPAEADEATIDFRVFASDEGNAPITNAKIYVGQYEKGVTQIADTDPGTVPNTAGCASNPPNPCTKNLGNIVKFVPGTYEFVVQAPGYGMQRVTATFFANQATEFNILMPTNWASSSKLATATGTGNPAALIDDTENTNWTSSTAPVNTQTVTVDLAGTDPRLVTLVNVSAFSARFTGLRQFKINTCLASVANLNCTAPASFTTIFTSAPDAFPGTNPRPGAPDQILRTFDVPDTLATHVQLEVVSNQCTGAAQFNGEQDDDPTNDTPCTATASATTVRAAELQVFSSPVTSIPNDPVVVLTMLAPLTGSAGGNITYDISYNNVGPGASEEARITDVLPPNTTFVSATNGGTFNLATGKVTWNLGTVPVSGTGTVHLTVRINPVVTTGSKILNKAEFAGKLTTSPPTAVAATLVQ